MEYETCLIGLNAILAKTYKRILLDYTYGLGKIYTGQDIHWARDTLGKIYTGQEIHWARYTLGKIYTGQEISAAKQSPSFEREYNLKYLGLIGNVFHTKDIEAAIEKGRTIKESLNTYTQKSVGLDPGFGSSNFGLCITETALLRWFMQKNTLDLTTMR